MDLEQARNHIAPIAIAGAEAVCAAFDTLDGAEGVSASDITAAFSDPVVAALWCVDRPGAIGGFDLYVEAKMRGWCGEPRERVEAEEGYYGRSAAYRAWFDAFASNAQLAEILFLQTSEARNRPATITDPHPPQAGGQ